MVSSGRIDSMFVRDDLPEFRTDLVPALPGLQMDNFSHGCTENLLKRFKLLSMEAESSNADTIKISSLYSRLTNRYQALEEQLLNLFWRLLLTMTS